MELPGVADAPGPDDAVRGTGGPADSPGADRPASGPPRPPGTDVALAAGLGAMAVADLLLDPRSVAWLPVEAMWLTWPLTLAMFLPLAWRRVAPLPVMAISGTATGVLTVLGVDLGSTIVAVIVALYSVAAYGTRMDGRVSLAISGGFIAAGWLTFWWRGGDVGPLDVALNVFAFVGVWALGDRTRVRRLAMAQLRARADEAERSRRLVAELAVADERRRIARELHDVVAHAVSVVVVQASAGRRVAGRDPAAAERSLAAIEGTSRDALRELRHLVDVLRDELPGGGERLPQPTLDDLEELVGRLRVAGVPVRLTDHDHGAVVPVGIGVSAYRIVQEALTNVLKHAGDVQEVTVTVVRHEDRVVLSVEDDGHGSGGDHAPGTGLVGMRERAAVFGGTLRASSRPGGGFVVRARLPFDGELPGTAPAEASAREPSSEPWSATTAGPPDADRQRPTMTLATRRGERP